MPYMNMPLPLYALNSLGVEQPLVDVKLVDDPSIQCTSQGNRKGKGKL